MRVEIRGLTQVRVHLQKAIDKDLIKQVVKKNGAELNQKMVREAVFKRFTPMAPKLYSTGATRRSISLTIADGGLTAKVKPGTHYAVYVEYGTYKMQAQPFVKPAFNSQKRIFISDIEKVMK